MASPKLTSRLVSDYTEDGEPLVEYRTFDVIHGDDVYEVGPNFADARAFLIRLTEAVMSGAEVFPCTWMVERTDGYVADFPSDLIVACGAPSVGDADGNGWSCWAGHGHRSDVEYFDDDEIAAAKAGAFLLPANARAMDGGLPR